MSQKNQLSFFNVFLFRWFISSLGLWVAAGILGDSFSIQNSFWVVVVSGLVLAALNTVVKPILVIFTLPAILFSLGLFMIVINGLLIVFASKLYEPLQVTNFWAAMLAGMIIGLVNYLVLTILENR